MKKAFFFDRDGTLNTPIFRYEDKYKKMMDCAPVDAKDLHVIPQAKEIVKMVIAKGFVPIVVTNQCDFKEKNIPFSAYEKITKKLCSELGIDRSNVFTCLHVNEDKCDCRKPKPGMILEAAKKFGIDISSSYLVGDSWKDVAAGKSAGLKHLFFIKRKGIKNKVAGNLDEMEKIEFDSKVSTVTSIEEVKSVLI